MKRLTVTRRKSPTDISRQFRRLAIEVLETRRLLAVDFGDAPAPYPTTLAEDGPRHTAQSPTISLVGNTITGESYEYGYDSALSDNGNILIVGDYGTEEAMADGHPRRAGRVRVFEFTGVDWQQRGTSLHGTSTDQMLGTNVAINSDGSVIFATSIGSNPSTQAYSFNGNVYEELGQAMPGRSGEAIAVNAAGTRVAFGTLLYEYKNESWTAVDLPSLYAPEHNVGYWVSMNPVGNVVAYGAPSNRPNVNGKVFVFSEGDASWTSHPVSVPLDASETFGRSLSLSESGSVLAVGDPWLTAEGNTPGGISVFDQDNGTFNAVSQIIGAESEKLGIDIELNASGTGLLAGSLSYDKNGSDFGDDHGRVQLFTKSGGAWVSEVSYPGENREDAFGRNISATSDLSRWTARIPNSLSFYENRTEVYDLVDDTLRLGLSRDNELNGINSDGADGDGADEDGVVFQAIRVGQADVTAIVNVQNAPDGARLDAWIDFNQDGSWDGKNERICTSMPVVNGNNLIRFAVPSNVPAGVTYARFRVSSGGALGVRGLATDGEVEDYQITLLDPVRRDVAWSVSEQAFHPSSAIGGTSDLELVDLDGDGDLDLVKNDHFGNNSGLHWFENTGHDFSKKHAIGSGSSYGRTRIEVVDLDGDGDLDVVGISVGGFYFFINDGISGDGNFLWTQQNNFINPTPAFREVKVGDLDGDGDCDFLLYANNSSTEEGELFWYEQTTPLVFNARTIPTTYDPLSGTRTSLDVLDFDGDGDLDIVMARERSLFVSWHENNNGTFQEHVITINNKHLGIQEVIDFDSDGDFDILLLVMSAEDGAQQSLLWYENQGHNAFFERTLFSRTVDQDGFYTFASGDFDGDGSIEIFLSSISGEVLYLRDMNSMSNEAQLIGNVRDMASNPWLRVREILPGDFDGDGDLDVLFGTLDGQHDSTNNPFIWLLNTSRPNVAKLQNAAFDVNSGPRTIPLNGINSGLGESQTLRVSSTISNASLAAITTSHQDPDQEGSLNISPKLNEIGSATINVIVEDGGQDNDLSTIADNVTHIEGFEIGVGLSSFEFGAPHQLQLRGENQHVTITNHENDGSGDAVTFTLDKSEWFGVNKGDMTGHLSSTVHVPQTMLPVGIRLLTNPDDSITFDSPERWRLEPSFLNEYPQDHVLVTIPGDRIVTVHGQSLWRNVLRNYDVTNNGETTVLDALQIIDELSRGSYTDLATGQLKSPSEVSEWPGIYYDTSGDGLATVFDALLVINEIARTSISSGEGELPDVAIQNWSRDLTPISTLSQRTEQLTESPSNASAIFASTPVVEQKVSNSRNIDAECQSIGSESLKTIDESILSLLSE